MSSKSLVFAGGAVALCGALASVAACSKSDPSALSTIGGLATSTPPKEFLEACVATLPDWIFAPSEGYRVREYAEVLASATDAKVTWEAAGVGRYILRGRINDRLTSKVLTRDIQMERLPLETDNVNCGPGAVLISRIVQNGVELNDDDRERFAMELAKLTSWRGRQVRQAEYRKRQEAAKAAPASSLAPPTIGNCHMETCSWSRTVAREVEPFADGTLHHIQVLGGTTVNGDEDVTHIRWNESPHRVDIRCSISLPSVTTEGEGVGYLELNAKGSSVPDVQMSAYSLYAEECHPEAKSLDPDALAKRFNYIAPVNQ